MKTRLTIDRFEGDHGTVAVLLTDGGVSYDLARGLLPPGVKPGEVLTLTVERDPVATKNVSEQTHKLQAELKTTDPGGDIKL